VPCAPISTRFTVFTASYRRLRNVTQFPLCRWCLALNSSSIALSIPASNARFAVLRRIPIFNSPLVKELSLAVSILYHTGSRIATPNCENPNGISKRQKRKNPFPTGAGNGDRGLDEVRFLFFVEFQVRVKFRRISVGNTNDNVAFLFHDRE